MRKYKSRVARRSTRRARRGTRKQSGGAWYNPFTWGKNSDAAPPPVAPAQSASLWDKLNPFKPKKLESDVTPAAAQNNNPPATGAATGAATADAAPVDAAPGSPPPEMNGGRKTRHRRRSPRRHRK